MREAPRLIGVIHLLPLPGAPGCANLEPGEALQRVAERAFKEAQLLVRAGFDALILENFGDVPFYADQVPPETIASLAVVAAAVREVAPVPLGINVLRNDARAALAIATVTGCDFIRVNVLSGVVATDQGLIQGQAAELIRERIRLGSSVRIFADAHVKHAVTLSSEDIAQAVADLASRGGSDAVVVSGAGTGRPIEMEKLQMAWREAQKSRIPLYIGSGVRADQLASVLPYCQGVIVSSDLRKKGQAGEPLDRLRVKKFMQAWKACFAPRNPKTGKNQKRRK